MGDSTPFISKPQKPGLFVTAGNRMEDLAASLWEVLRAPLPPEEPEILVVQDPGLGRWLAQFLARKAGVLANARLIQPNFFLSEIFSRVTGVHSEEPARLFGAEALGYRVAAILPSLLDDPAFSTIRRYLADDREGEKLVPLSRELGRVLDRYMLFRAGMILNWEMGRANHWQAKLWRAVKNDLPGLHRPGMLLSFRKEMEALATGDPRLPARVSVFGVGALPPLILNVLSSLAQKIPVRLFHANPCPDWWADLVSDKEIGRIIRRAGRADRDGLHLYKENALLASMGAVGRDFLVALQDVSHQTFEAFSPPGGETLLARIQRDVFLLSEPRSAGGREVLGPEDASLSVHVCHGPWRETEVLRDLLLDAFEQDPDLAPENILVAAPDIEPYAPFIDAVFGAAPDDGRKIPYSIAGRSFAGQSASALAFASLMDLVQSRFTASGVLDFLSLAPVMERFDLNEEDLETVEGFAARAGVRWGEDGAHRKELDLPPEEAHTWRQGMDRLLAGFAMAGDGSTLVNGVLPAEGLETQDGRVLGSFLDFLEAVFAARRALAGTRSAAGWSLVLKECVDALMAPPGEDPGGWTALMGALSALGKQAGEAGFTREIGLLPAADFIRDRLAGQPDTGGFLRQGVTFAPVRSARGAPFDIIVLMGMQDGAFPGQNSLPGFDLMARYPLPGDRSRRADDRYLFLETLLSARKRLILTYTGQSATDSQDIPPSALVDELLEYVRANYEDPEGQEAARRIVVRHRLQAFGPDYFDPARPLLFSYSRDLCEAARRGAEAGSSAPFFEEGRPLDAEEAPAAEISLSRLTDFFKNPARALLHERLLVRPGVPEAGAETAEPFSLAGLDNYLLADALTRHALSGHRPESFFDIARAQGVLPHGEPGRAAFQRAVFRLEPFLASVARLSKEPWPPLDLSLEIPPVTLSARLAPLTGQGLFIHRPARVKDRDRVDGWIRHLVLQAAPGEVPRRTVILGTDRKAVFDSLPPDDARGFLKNLAVLFLEGQTRPLPFFPSASLAFARAVHAGKPLRTARDQARKAFEKAWNEGGDPAVDLAFSGQDPLGPEFEELARALLTPLLEHLWEE